jgi:glycerol dehydrogenase
VQNVYSSPGRYTQGPAVTDQLVGEMAFLGLEGPVLIVAGPTVTKLLGKRWKTIFASVGIPCQLHPFAGQCTIAEIDAVAEVAHRSGAATLLAAGGGKVLDTTRAAAAKRKVPFISCPTVASTDSPCSAIAVIYSERGVYETFHSFSHNPDLVLVDTEVIVQSPLRYFVAGMGDGLSTVFEARACVAGARENLRGGLTTLAAAEIGELCYRTLMEEGRTALADMRNQEVTPAFERVVEANTLLSGIGFESAGLAAAHGIHNAMTVAEGTHSYLHGEKVAFGVLVHLMLEAQAEEVVAEVVAFCRDVGLPRTLAGVGLDAADEQTLQQIAQAATEPGSLVHNEPFEVTPEKVVQAILAADRVGNLP